MCPGETVKRYRYAIQVDQCRGLVGASQAPDYRLVLWMLVNQVRRLCQFKISEIETWGYSAAHERPRFPVSHVRGEPVPGGDDGLKNLAGIGIVS